MGKQSCFVPILYLLFSPSLLVGAKLYLEDPDKVFELSYFYCQIVYPYLFVILPLSFLRFTVAGPYSQVFLQYEAKKTIRSILYLLVLSDFVLLLLSLSALNGFDILPVHVCAHLVIISVYYLYISIIISKMSRQIEIAYLFLFVYTVMNIVHAASHVQFPFYRLYPGSPFDLYSYLPFLLLCIVLSVALYVYEKYKAW